MERMRMRTREAVADGMRMDNQVVANGSRGTLQSVDSRMNNSLQIYGCVRMRMCARMRWRFTTLKKFAKSKNFKV